MLLSVLRDKSTTKSTPGILKINGNLHCFTLEDVQRFGPEGTMRAEDKVYGKTAIPCGKYRVSMAAFRGDQKRIYPLLHDVPFFKGVFVHGGNTEEDTLGCILVGNKRAVDRVWDCSPALSGLCHYITKAIESGGEVWLEVKNE